MERSLRAEPLLDRLEAGEPFKLLGGVPPSESAATARQVCRVLPDTLFLDGKLRLLTFLHYLRFLLRYA